MPLTTAIHVKCKIPSPQRNCYYIIAASYTQWHLRFKKLWQVLSCMLVLINWWRPSRVWEERGQILCPVAVRKKDKLGDKAHGRWRESPAPTFASSCLVFGSKRRNTCHVFNCKLRDTKPREHFLGTRLESFLHSHRFVTLGFLKSF